VNREQKELAIKGIFDAINHDGQWHEVVSPYGGYTNSYRVHGYKFNEQWVYLVDARSGNGHVPADRVGIVIVDEFSVTYRPACFKKHLHKFMGENND
jgi:hypothetical protein